MADVSDERLAELIADVEAEFIADTKAAWVEARRRYKADHLLALRELQTHRARDGYVLVPVTTWNKYAWHNDDCDAIYRAGELRYPLVPCSCGFNAALGEPLALRSQARDGYVLVPRVRLDELESRERRLKAMMPLFTEARDALPTISLASAKLRGLDLTLADRMDEVGVKEKWEARDRAMLSAAPKAD